ncbi:hypothetical protein LZ32DRAFT_628739 [Colletotrichum eremochloae]|nr:hypothetical protein LZ32DRAFT_628739 [Colletotrichum eremochloae]
MAWHLQTSPGEGPSNPRSLPAVAHQVPGSDLDLASNDDMLLSAFDLTILPILGESEEHSHAEAPGRRQHHHRSGTYCGQWAHAYEHQVRWNLYLVTSTAQPYPGNMRSAAMVISPSTRSFSPSFALLSTASACNLRPVWNIHLSIFGISTGTNTSI